MVYKITPVMILRRIFINNNFKSKMELGGLKNEKILEKTIKTLILRILIVLLCIKINVKRTRLKKYSSKTVLEHILK